MANRALCPADPLKPVPGKRVQSLVWQPADEAAAAADNSLVFNHAKLITQAVSATRQEVEQLILLSGFILEKFTLREL